MTRLVIFCLFLSGLAIVMNFKGYRDIPVNSEKFSIEKATSDYEEYNRTMEELAEIHKEATTPKVVTGEVIEEKSIIELSTPALVRADKLYKQCIACHGKAGEGKSANKAPMIGGQMDWYITKQLTDMREGVRINQNMLSIVKKLSDEDISDLAGYLSKFPWPNK